MFVQLPALPSLSGDVYYVYVNTAHVVSFSGDESTCVVRVFPAGPHDTYKVPLSASEVARRLCGES